MGLELFQKDVLLSAHTSWLIGGPAEYFFQPKSVVELQEAQETAKKENLNVTVLGGGSNVLIGDLGIKGLVICLSKLTGLEIVEDHKGFSFWAMSGTTKGEVLRLFLKKKLPPACLLAGLPGQVGGGVVMNAGVTEKIKPREFSEIVKAVEVLRENGEIKIVESTKMHWEYRNCLGWKPGIITRVLFDWENVPNDDVQSKVKLLNQNRLKLQPLDLPSCGSVFKNPLPHHAGQLIESVRLKGVKQGGAQISEKHGNFIVNNGGATALDVKFLMELCQKKVKDVCGVVLTTEVISLGKFK